MKKIVFLFLCVASLAFSAQQEATNNTLRDYKIEQLQKEIDELKKDVDEAKKSQKDIESLKERLGDVNNRISDISGSVDRFGIVLTVLLLVGGFVTYISVKSKAKDEARETAKKETEEWTIKEGKETLEKIVNELGKVAKEQIEIAVQNAQEEIKNQSKAEELFMQGNSFYYAKEYAKAIESYQKVIKVNPKRDDAYNNIGVTYNMQKEYDKAIESYQKAIDINPESDNAYYGLGLVYGKQEKYDKAIKAYQEAIEINPKKDNVYVNLFELYLIQNLVFTDEAHFIELFQENKSVFMIYEMLKILQAIAKSSSYVLSKEAWIQKYEGIKKSDWGWEEIDNWLSRMEEGETKVQLLEALTFFKANLNA